MSKQDLKAVAVVLVFGVLGCSKAQRSLPGDAGAAPAANESNAATASDETPETVTGAGGRQDSSGSGGQAAPGGGGAAGELGAGGDRDGIGGDPTAPNGGGAGGEDESPNAGGRAGTGGGSGGDPANDSGGAGAATSGLTGQAGDGGASGGTLSGGTSGGGASSGGTSGGGASSGGASGSGTSSGGASNGGTSSGGTSSGGEAGAASGGAASCGDGAVSGGEVCDDGNLWLNDGCGSDCEGELICAAPMLSCDGFDSCLLLGEMFPNSCLARCVAADDVQCCTVPNDADPTCPPEFPFSVNAIAASDPQFMQIQSTVLGETGAPSCGPIVALAGVGASLNGPHNGGVVRLSATFSGGDTQTLQLPGGPLDPIQFPAFLQVDRPNARLSLSYELDVCQNATPCSTNISAANVTLYFSRFAPDAVTDATFVPEEPRISGDDDALFIAFLDTSGGNGAAMLTGGEVLATSGPYYLSAPQYQTAFEPMQLSTPGADAQRPALVHGRDTDDATFGDTHVVWIEEDSSLRTARVADDGTVEASGEIHAGTALRSAEIVRLSLDHFAVSFIESVASVDRLRAIALDIDGAPSSEVVDITEGEGDVSDPFLVGPPAEGGGSVAGAAWIDDRTGARQVYFRNLDPTTLVPLFSLVNAAPGAVDPKTPVVGNTATGNLYYTDHRSGAAQIFEVASLGATPEPYLPAGSMRPSLPRPATFPSDGRARASIIGWEQEGQQDSVRLGDRGVSLACSTSTTRDLDLAETSIFEVGVAANNPGTSPRVFGTWVQDGVVMVKQMTSLTARTSPECAPSELFCSHPQELSRCNLDGRGAERVEFCAYPTECDAVLGGCACPPGPWCQGSVATTCNPDGSVQSGGVDCAASGERCVRGQCQPLWFEDDFETSTGDDWLYGTGTVERRVVAGGGAEGSERSLRIITIAPGFLVHEFDRSVPAHLSFWVRGGDFGVEATMAFGDGFRDLLVIGSGIKIRDPLTEDYLGPESIPNQWQHIELDFDWQARRVIYSVDGVPYGDVPFDSDVGSSLLSWRIATGRLTRPLWIDQIRME